MLEATSLQMLFSTVELVYEGNRAFYQKLMEAGESKIGASFSEMVTRSLILDQSTKVRLLHSLLQSPSRSYGPDRSSAQDGQEVRRVGDGKEPKHQGPTYPRFLRHSLSTNYEVSPAPSRTSKADR